jgi:two-component system cell cycle sensor histidine kinase/response regulator CckA
VRSAARVAYDDGNWRTAGPHRPVLTFVRLGDGNAAVEMLRRHAETVGLMLLDVTLPGLSSRDVLQEARRIRPGIRVILTSALSQKEVDGSFAGLQVNHFIRKPYRLAALIELLQRVLPAE